jgi:hypothetical protein
MESDGCFPEVPEILTDVEYFSKVGFDDHLLSTFNIYEKDGTYYWPINSRQGYIQKGRFRPPDPEKEARLEWAIVYERYADTPVQYSSTLAIFCFTSQLLTEDGRNISRR